MGDADILPALGRVPGHVFWRARGRVVAMTAQLVPDEVDLPAYGVLVALVGSRPCSQQQLADRIAVSRTTLTRVARDLTERGYVDRARRGGDRRSYDLVRTSAGAAAMRTWRRDVRALERALRRPLGAEAGDELVALLQRAATAQALRETPTELAASIAHLVPRIHESMHREFVRTLAPAGVEPAEFGLLSALRETGAVPQSELAHWLGVSGARVVGLVDRLEDKGLVERRRSVVDRRAQVVHARPAAARLSRRFARRAPTLVGGERGLSVPESDRLLELLRCLVLSPLPGSGS